MNTKKHYLSPFFSSKAKGLALPQDQRITWRDNSGLSDGWTYNTDLTGGYYDAGDNVKFGFPMAFTTTMLAWSVIEFGDLMPPNELRNTMVAIRWATDYLLKTVSQPNRIFVQVGDPNVDHSCWERPEDMDTPRTVYSVDAPNPASDVAGETAAALAASSMALRSSDPGYADTLLRNAIKAFQFADNYRGAYSDNSNIRDGVCPFYCDFDGYQDELLWGAAWLRRASYDDTYLSYIESNGRTLGADDNINEFGWDNKHAGLNVLVSKQAKRQVDYILGDNPLGLSYMVGYSNNYPQRIHHRGSSLPSIKDHPEFIACKEGSIYFNSTNPNPNVLVGAIVGGPTRWWRNYAFMVLFLLNANGFDFIGRASDQLGRRLKVRGLEDIVFYKYLAMASNDDIVEGSISTLLIDSLRTNQNGDALSPEEIAWVDSCLIKDPEISDGDWSSMKDALIEILGLQPDSHDSSAPGTDSFPGGTDIEMLHSAESGLVKSSGGTDVGSIKINKETETSNDEFPIKEECGNSLSQHFQGDLSVSLSNAFLPNYREENKRMSESIDSRLSIGCSTDEIEPSIEDIFRIWDLGIPVEEDEFVKQLNKALSESSDQLIQSRTDDSGAWKDCKEESVDDLIAGIADLSLTERFK
ncbi:hypothetical protein GH714_031102 [Hevea brasiliensis]|uniref:Endoglucanase n=1 Tax=Hevea brasiliensis TaxID=3981 RepID=A0A6A6NDH3_HEVBR|nr:hypothetical protein GH714_031102 [Hevea brasiliensis]